MPLHLDQSHPRASSGFRGHPRHDHHDSRVGRVEAEVEDVHHDSQYRDPPLMIPLLLSYGRISRSNLLSVLARNVSLGAILILLPI